MNPFSISLIVSLLAT